MRGPNNRGHRNEDDTWLTPPELLKALGKFDLDPCCPPLMPWRTARVMLTNEKPDSFLVRSPWVKAKPKLVESGLTTEWRGRAFLNFPFSDPRSWVERMTTHKNGIVVAPAKSTDTVWCQLLLSTCFAVLFLDERISFCYLDGTSSGGKWSPYLLAAYGAENVRVLHRISQTHEWRGVVMKRSYF